MPSSIPREIKILSIGFLLIFFGFGGVERYVTQFFSDRGMIDAGFNSLILIYVFFTLSDPYSAVFVSRLGAKKCMVLGSIFYIAYILSLLSNSPATIYLASVLLGIGASLLWTGQSTYLVRASKSESYGKNSGFYSTLQSLGLGIGILTLGFLTSRVSFEKAFLLFSIFPLAGLIVLSRLRGFRAEKNQNHFRLMKKSLSSKTALKLSALWFAVNFGNGLTLGALPLQIKNLLGAPFIGILSSMFFIAPVLFSFFFGKLSDSAGRKNVIALALALLLASFASLYFQTATTLVAGIALYSLNSAIIRPASYALIGDISTRKNLAFIAALFWTAQNIGTVAALALSRLLNLDILHIYSISIIVVIMCSYLVLSTLAGLRTGEIRARISREISGR